MREFTTIRHSNPPTRPVRPPDAVRRVLALMVALMLLLVVCCSTVFLLHLRDMAMAAAAANTQAVARLVDEHLTRTLTSTDSVLRRAVRVAQERLRGQISAADEVQKLLDLQETLPERGILLITDAKGLVIAASAPPGENSTGSIELGDRTWFQKLVAGQEMVVGQLIRSRYRTELVFTLSRRISDDLGGFAGAVTIGLNAQFFTDFHQSLVLGQRGYIAATTDGMVMLRQPDADAYVGASVRDGKGSRMAAIEPNGTLRSTSPLDGVDRMVSYRTLAGFGVVVRAGMAMDDVLDPWRQTALLVLGAVVVVTLCLMGLALLAFHGIAREEAFTAGLEVVIRERTEETEHRAAEARQANESKTRFLAAASHDLRQPLQAAGMFTEVLAAQISDPGQGRVVDKLRQSIEATNSLLTTLLDVSSLEAGKIKPNITTFRLMPLLVGLVEQIEPEASARGLSITVAPTSAVISSDPILLERLLRNLLINATRYTESGGILVGCRRRGPDVAILVCDTGIGIPPDKADLVFDDFTRLDGPSDQRGGRGLGLGLGVVRRMAALLGHRLELHSVPGRGSCFGVVVRRG
ncbi:MAG: ATP-binding protein [Phaeospirillum sp.]|nr:ATP-binding protein [Phaeospirillum sp.]